jgi:hypothetical protein
LIAPNGRLTLWAGAEAASLDVGGCGNGNFTIFDGEVAGGKGVVKFVKAKV